MKTLQLNTRITSLLTIAIFVIAQCLVVPTAFSADNLFETRQEDIKTFAAEQTLQDAQTQQTLTGEELVLLDERQQDVLGVGGSTVLKKIESNLEIPAMLEMQKIMDVGPTNLQPVFRSRTEDDNNNRIDYLNPDGNLAGTVFLDHDRNPLYTRLYSQNNSGEVNRHDDYMSDGVSLVQDANGYFQFDANEVSKIDETYYKSEDGKHAGFYFFQEGEKVLARTYEHAYDDGVLSHTTYDPEGVDFQDVQGFYVGDVQDGTDIFEKSYYNQKGDLFATEIMDDENNPRAVQFLHYSQDENLDKMWKHDLIRVEVYDRDGLTYSQGATYNAQTREEGLGYVNIAVNDDNALRERAYLNDNKMLGSEYFHNGEVIATRIYEHAGENSAELVAHETYRAGHKYFMPLIKRGEEEIVVSDPNGMDIRAHRAHIEGYKVMPLGYSDGDETIDTGLIERSYYSRETNPDHTRNIIGTEYYDNLGQDVVATRLYDYVEDGRRLTHETYEPRDVRFIQMPTYNFIPPEGDGLIGHYERENGFYSVARFYGGAIERGYYNAEGGIVASVHYGESDNPFENFYSTIKHAVNTMVYENANDGRQVAAMTAYDPNAVEIGRGEDGFYYASAGEDGVRDKTYFDTEGNIVGTEFFNQPTKYGADGYIELDHTRLYVVDGIGRIEQHTSYVPDRVRFDLDQSTGFYRQDWNGTDDREVGRIEQTYYNASNNEIRMVGTTYFRNDSNGDSSEFLTQIYGYAREGQISAVHAFRPGGVQFEYQDDHLFNAEVVDKSKLANDTYLDQNQQKIAEIFYDKDPDSNGRNSIALANLYRTNRWGINNASDNFININRLDLQTDEDGFYRIDLDGQRVSTVYLGLDTEVVVEDPLNPIDWEEYLGPNRLRQISYYGKLAPTLPIGVDYYKDDGETVNFQVVEVYDPDFQHIRREFFEPGFLQFVENPGTGFFEIRRVSEDSEIEHLPLCHQTLQSDGTVSSNC